MRRELILLILICIISISLPASANERSYEVVARFSYNFFDFLVEVDLIDDVEEKFLIRDQRVGPDISLGGLFWLTDDLATEVGVNYLDFDLDYDEYDLRVINRFVGPYIKGHYNLHESIRVNSGLVYSFYNGRIIEGGDILFVEGEYEGEGLGFLCGVDIIHPLSDRVNVEVNFGYKSIWTSIDRYEEGGDDLFDDIYEGLEMRSSGYSVGVGINYRF